MLNVFSSIVYDKDISEVTVEEVEEAAVVAIKYKNNISDYAATVWNMQQQNNLLHRPAT